MFSDYIPRIFHLKRVISTCWAGNIIRQKRNLTDWEHEQGDIWKMCLLIEMEASASLRVGHATATLLPPTEWSPVGCLIYRRSPHHPGTHLQACLAPQSVYRPGQEHPPPYLSGTMSPLETLTYWPSSRASFRNQSHSPPLHQIQEYVLNAYCVFNRSKWKPP